MAVGLLYVYQYLAIPIYLHRSAPQMISHHGSLSFPPMLLDIAPIPAKAEGVKAGTAQGAARGPASQAASGSWAAAGQHALGGQAIKRGHDGDASDRSLEWGTA
jgi:hypothetical protein